MPPANIPEASLVTVGNLTIPGRLLGDPIAANIPRYLVAVFVKAESSTAWGRLGFTIDILDLNRPGNPLDSRHKVAVDQVQEGILGPFTDVETGAFYAPGERLRVVIAGTLGFRFVTTAAGTIGPRSIMGTAGPLGRDVLLPEATVSFDVTVPPPPNAI
jgi:hypothetical protein